MRQYSHFKFSQGPNKMFSLNKGIFAVLRIRNYFSRIRIRIRIRQFMENTFELRSSKHRKKQIFGNLYIFRPGLLTKNTSKRGKKANLLKSVHFESFVLVSGKENLTWIWIRIRIRNWLRIRIRILTCNSFRIRADLQHWIFVFTLQINKLLEKETPLLKYSQIPQHPSLGRASAQGK